MATLTIDPTKPVKAQFLDLVARTTRTRHLEGNVLLGTPSRVTLADPAETMISIAIRAKQFQNDRVVRYRRIYLNDAFRYQRLEIEGNESTSEQVIIDRFNELGYTQLILSELVVSEVVTTATPDVYEVTITAKPESLVYIGQVKVTLKGTATELEVQSDTIDRFTPKYWRLDGPRTMSLALTTTDTTLEAFFIARKTGDLSGLIWDSKDTKDHQLLGYEHKTDYRDCVWEFDVEVSDTMAEIADPLKGLVLTVYGLDEFGFGYDWYVALRHYATMINPRKARIRLDWNTVKAGFYADENINLEKIETIFFAGVASSYDAVSPSEPLEEPARCWIRLTNQVVTGAGAKLTRQRVSVAAHSIGMCTSYDDHYDLSPQRIIENCHALGYRGWINHYVGMSTYPNREWNPGEQRFRTNGSQPAINEASQKWHADFAKYCKQYGYELMQSVSYELFSEFCPYEWTQRDWDDNYAATGWSPPSYLMSPCVNAAMTWMRKAFVEFSAIADEAGLDVIMQVGEPWWWWNGSTSKPCIYDYQTRLAFNTETGLFAPEFPTISSNLTGTPYDEYKQFLSRTLGESVLSMCTAVKDVYPNAKTTTLFFLPSIITPEVGIMQEINYPKQQYSQAPLDFFMTEAYDWLITAQVLRAEDSLRLPIQDLGYTADRLQYLAGFVPDASMAEILKFDPTGPYRREIWQRIFGNMRNNLTYTGLRQYIWSYPQVMADSITYLPEDNLSHFYVGQERWSAVRDDRPYDSSDGDPESPTHGNTGGTVGNGDYLPARPTNLHCMRNSWGDVTISWDLIDDKVADPQFLLELFELESSTVLKAINTSSKVVVIDRAEVLDIYGSVPTHLQYRVRRVGGPSSQITSQPLENDPSEIQPPTNLRGSYTSWGDITLEWDFAGDENVFKVELLEGQNVVWTKQVTGKTVPFSVEESVPVFGYTPTYITARVAALGGAAITASMNLTLDNSVGHSFLAVGDSNMAAAFNNASGLTHDHYSAITFRQLHAQYNGLRRWEVNPLDMAYGSAVVDYAGSETYQQGSEESNFYWNLETNSPGPNLSKLTEYLTTGAKVDGVLWVLRNDMTAFGSTSRPIIPSPLRSYQAHMAVFNHIREACNDPDLPIYISAAISGYVGTAPIMPGQLRQMQLVQAMLCKNMSNVFMAADQPATSMNDFVLEAGDIRIHLTPERYHNLSRMFADGIRDGVNLAATGQPYDPDAMVVAPTILEVKHTLDGISIAFEDALRRDVPGATFNVRMIDTMSPDRAVIRDLGSFSESPAIYTVEQYTADFGFLPGYIGFDIQQTQGGQSSERVYWNGNVRVPETPTGGTATKNPENGDITLSWDAGVGTGWQCEIKNVENGSTISTRMVSTPTDVFTTAEQIAAYGYTVSYVFWNVTAVDPDGAASRKQSFQANA